MKTPKTTSKKTSIRHYYGNVVHFGQFGGDKEKLLEFLAEDCKKQGKKLVKIMHSEGTIYGDCYSWKGIV